MRCLGLDLGGTKLLARARVDGVDAGRLRLPTGPDTGPEAALALVREAAHTLLDGRVDGVACGFPGLVGPGGRVRSSVILRGWSEVDWAGRLRDALGAPHAVVDNDVNLAALAEARARAPLPTGGMLYVAAGTGYGGALVDGRGRLWRGHHGVAGEVGHMRAVSDGPRCDCGRLGCLHAVASGARLVERLGLPPGASLADAPAVARHRVLTGAGRHLGRVLADAVQLLDVPLVVVGGGLVQAGPTLLDAARPELFEGVFPEAAEGLALEPARCGYDAAVLGALQEACP